MDEREPILECLCRERDGETLRVVKPTELSLDRLKFLWDQLKDYKVLFNDWVQGDFRAFVDHFVVQVNGEARATGLMWDVDDVGMFLLNEIRPAISACAHFTFWDERFRGREDLCRAMLRYVFETYQFKRIETRVPLYARSALAATERIGFIQEGRLRDSVLYEGEWFDVNIYSILPDDMDSLEPDSWRHKKLVCWGCGKIYEQRFGKEKK